MAELVTCPDRVLELVERFERNAPAYRDGRYKEEQLRVEFLNPFFKALGWDVDNTKGYAEAYKDVVHEDRIRIGGKAKAPDYSFRIGGQRKFFVEAKKPSVNIEQDVTPAYQLRRYAWSAKLPLSILTDFEELAVYDTRVKPDKGDPPRTARVMYLSYKEYPERWEEIASIFAKESILMGSFDKYAEKEDRRGTEEVDDVFLEEIEAWREALAIDIAHRNPELSERELNFAVQRTIDRIVFLRICEDRAIEPYGKLKELVDRKNVYEALVKDFRQADDRYNSGLFHFKEDSERGEHPDTLTPQLSVSNEALRDILGDLYYPESPYEFSVLPTDILGQVYERFLGKVIELGEDHEASVKAKPEVRKAGGVYYTPTYIVDYIVEETIGPLLEGKDWTKVRDLRIVDPACGSGSFLIGAYQYLLDWHLQHYIDTETETHARGRPPRVYKDARGEWQLTTQEKKRILLDNIYGVDIDRQAVEVTKLSLLLKMLEGESGESLDNQLQIFQERVLPDLSANIKCGNSLIGSDFYQGVQIGMLDEEELYRINVFDWEDEFREIFGEGGFDAVIGNPPYIPIETMTVEEKEYYKSKHPQLTRKYDSSVIFILAMLPHLKPEGRLGYISSVTWQTGVNYAKLRKHLFKTAGVERLINLPFDTFEDAYVDAGLYVLTSQPTDQYLLYRFPKQEKNPTLDNLPFIEVPSHLTQAPHYKIVLNPKAQEIIVRSRASEDYEQLGDFTISTQGLSPSRFELHEELKEDDWFPYLADGQVYRYVLEIEDLQYVPMEDKESLKRFYKAEPKMLIRRVINRQDRLMVAYTDRRLVFKKDINPFVLTDAQWSPLYVLGVLNSQLISYLYVNTSSIATKDDFRQTTLTELRGLPIPRPDERAPQVEELVDRMHTLLQKQEKARTGHDRRMLERQITATDRQIDRLVYELYDLTDEEIDIVESSVR